jgi:hypothetical protein
MILDATPENIPQGKFGEMINIASPDEQIRNELFTAFGISTETRSFEKYRDAVRVLLGSTMFQYHNIGIAKAAPESESTGWDIYLYHFEEPSPFASPRGFVVS